MSGAIKEPFRSPRRCARIEHVFDCGLHPSGAGHTFQINSCIE
jgi:hypothetical protein